MGKRGHVKDKQCIKLFAAIAELLLISLVANGGAIMYCCHILAMKHIICKNVKYLLGKKSLLFDNVNHLILHNNI